MMISYDSSLADRRTGGPAAPAASLVAPASRTSRLDRSAPAAPGGQLQLQPGAEVLAAGAGAPPAEAGDRLCPGAPGSSEGCWLALCAAVAGALQRLTRLWRSLGGLGARERAPGARHSRAAPLG